MKTHFQKRNFRAGSMRMYNIIRHQATSLENFQPKLELNVQVF